MKTWEHFWQLHGDEVAAVFYDDDEEDEFRTDIIYIVTQKGNVIFCNVKLVEHGNDVKPVVTLFSALMDVFPRCSILDWKHGDGCRAVERGYCFTRFVYGLFRERPFLIGNFRSERCFETYFERGGGSVETVWRGGLYAYRR